MKKALRKMSLLLMVALVVTFTFSGCGSSENSNESTAASTVTQSQASKAEETTAADPLAERLSLSMAYWGAGSFGNDQWYKDLSEMFNVDITFINLDWSDFVQKIKLMASTNELPDFTAGPLPSSDYFTLANQGMLKALPDDLSAYPDLQKFMSAELFEAFKVGGKYYTVPRTHNRDTANNIPSWRFLVRKDWMQQCGITQDPQTWDELFEMCKTFVQKNASGKKQTIGFTANNSDTLTYPIRYSMGNAYDSWEQVDGKWMPGNLGQSNLGWINIMRKYYKEGAIDKDFALNKNDDGRNKFVSGTAGLLIYSLAANDYDVLVKDFEEANPGKKASDCLKVLMYPKNDKGEIRIQNDSLIGTGTYFGASSSDEKMDRVLRIMNYFLTDEGLMFGNYGKEGRDYKLNGDSFERINTKGYPTQGIASMTYWMVDFTRSSPAIPKVIRDEVNQNYDFLAKNAVKDEAHFDINWLDTPAKTKWNYSTELTDGIAKIIVANDPVEKMYKALTDSIIANGGNDAIKEVNDYMSKK